MRAQPSCGSQILFKDLAAPAESLPVILLNLTGPIQERHDLSTCAWIFRSK